MVIFQGSTFRLRGCAFGLAVYSWYPRLNSLYYRQTLTEKFIIASVWLFFFIVVTRTLSVIFQWVLAIVGVQYGSSIAWHEPSVLETLYAYGGQFILSTHFIITNFPFNSTLNRYINLKSFVTCCLLVTTFFPFHSLFKFLHRSKNTGWSST